MARESFETLPELLAEIAEVAGLDAALALADRYGGVRVDIPRRAKPGDWITDCVGDKAAKQICDHFRAFNADGRELAAYRVVVPLGPGGAIAQARQILIRELEKGETPRKAARIAGLHERTAWRYKARMAGRTDPNQGVLI